MSEQYHNGAGISCPICGNYAQAMTTERRKEKGSEHWMRVEAMSDAARRGRSEMKALRDAFDAMVIVAPWGQPCYRTHNGVPMGMPARVEKKVRAALKAMGKKPPRRDGR